MYYRTTEGNLSALLASLTAPLLQLYNSTVRMRSSYLILCLVLMLMNINSGLSRIKSRNTKTSVNKKPSTKIPKTNIDLKPGHLHYRGSRLTLNFTMADESQVYAANYSMFPDELYYPRPTTVKDYEEFLGPCMNTTLELETNKEKISQLCSEDVYTRVTTRIIEFLCTENYYRKNNNAGLCPNGLWMVTTVTVMLLVMKTLG